MTLYAFRVVENDKPTGYHGMITAYNLADLFECIDEFVSPYDVQIKKVQYIGFCYKTEYSDGDEWPETPEKPELELSELVREALFDSPDTGWHTPDWLKIRYKKSA